MMISIQQKKSTYQEPRQYWVKISPYQERRVCTYLQDLQEDMAIGSQGGRLDRTWLEPNVISAEGWRDEVALFIAWIHGAIVTLLYGSFVAFFDEFETRDYVIVKIKNCLCCG